MDIRVFPDYAALSDYAAQSVAEQIHSKPSSVLGMATGSTPTGLYQNLVQRYKTGELSLADVTTFNLDEYLDLPVHHPQSYYTFMQEHLFRHVNVKPERIHFPSGDESGTLYEEAIRMAGGIDLQILGIGSNGHIGFNEPGSSFTSRTRVVDLATRTIQDNARFFAHANEVPRRAVTMGIGTILNARRIILLANGHGKAEAVAAALENPPTPSLPASCLQEHAHVLVLLDQLAAQKLKHS